MLQMLGLGQELGLILLGFPRTGGMPASILAQLLVEGVTDAEMDVTILTDQVGWG